MRTYKEGLQLASFAGWGLITVVGFDIIKVMPYNPASYLFLAFAYMFMIGNLRGIEY